MRADTYPGNLTHFLAELEEWLEASELPSDGVTLGPLTIAVWDLTEEGDLKESTNAGEWHHQLLRDANAFVFARSLVRDREPQILEVAESPLASAIETALHTLTTAENGDVTLRLLQSTRRHTTALWLHKNWDDDEFIIVQSPTIKVQQRLNRDGLLAALAGSDVAGLSNASPVAAVAVPITPPAPTSDVNMWQADQTRRRRPVRTPIEAR